MTVTIADKIAAFFIEFFAANLRNARNRSVRPHP
jgi:hypothetical protein